MKSNDYKLFAQTIKVIREGKLKELEFTAEQLSDIRHRNGSSALVCAVQEGGLHRIKGGVTAAQLKADKSHKGVSALLLAAQEGWLHQIHGDITAADLAAEQLPDHTSALIGAAYNGELYLLKGGITAGELAATHDDNGYSGLHAAAAGLCLDQVEGGVSLEQLISVQDRKGFTPLYWAAREGSINQIRGGVTLAQMRSMRCDEKRSAFEVALANDNHDQIPGGNPDAVDCKGRSDDDLVDMAEWSSETAAGMLAEGDKRTGHRLMLKAAIELSWHGKACAVLAYHHHNHRNYREALKFAVKAARLLPNEAKGWVVLGEIYRSLRQFSRSYQAAERSLERDPNFARTHLLLAALKSELGLAQTEVEAHLRKAIELDPKDPNCWICLTAHLKEAGKHEEASAAHVEFRRLVALQQEPSAEEIVRAE